jgi:hypothetical protein
MFTITDKKHLYEYMEMSDSDVNVKNFRLFYRGKKTNLIWYDGQVIYLPYEFFELKNLINVDMKKRHKCALFLSEQELIQELKEKKINFILEKSLSELIDRVQRASFMLLNDDVAIESIYDFDYSNIVEPIYLGKGMWLNIDN